MPALNANKGLLQHFGGEPGQNFKARRGQKKAPAAGQGSLSHFAMCPDRREEALDRQQDKQSPIMIRSISQQIRLLGHAPLTMAATREALRRLTLAPQADIADLIRSCYGSTDFHRGVAAFGTRVRIDWEGR
jgi:hypothetical protein